RPVTADPADDRCRLQPDLDAPLDVVQEFGRQPALRVRSRAVTPGGAGQLGDLVTGRRIADDDEDPRLLVLRARRMDGRLETPFQHVVVHRSPVELATGALVEEDLE